jgi:pseudouridine-5'-monophosphatase
MRGKPEPDMFLMAAKERLGFAVGNAQGSCTDEERNVRAKGLVFEDGLAGVQGGKRAGMNGMFNFLAESIKMPTHDFPFCSRLGT